MPPTAAPGAVAGRARWRCQTGAVAGPSDSTAAPDALERARHLVTRDGDAATVSAGYLDLLARRGVPSTGRAQDLMLSRLVPEIYERLWRPALGRIAKGPWGPGMEEEYRLARELLGLRPRSGATVLDLACGPGNFTRELARTAGTEGLAVGIDVSETMLARAVEDTRRAGLRNVAYVRGDAEKLPFQAEAFDAVCCFAALHLFSSPERALDRMHAVLRAGGRLAILTSARRGPAPVARLESAVGAMSGMRVFGRRELRRALVERGFVDVEQCLAGVTQLVGATRA
jgi:SAM-dependent methyltransferase